MQFYAQCEGVSTFTILATCPGDEVAIAGNFQLNCVDAATVNYTWTFEDLDGNQLIPDEIGSLNEDEMLPVLVLPSGLINESFLACLTIEVFDIGAQLLEELEFCSTYNFTAPSLTDETFSISCDGHCFQIASYEMMWQYSYTLDGQPFNIQEYYYQPYCMEEGTHLFEAVDGLGCYDSYVFEVVGVMSDNNMDCSTAIPLVNGELSYDEVCSPMDADSDCNNFNQLADDWFVINSEDFIHLNVGVELVGDTIAVYGVQVWEEQIPGDCQSIELFYCGYINEIQSCFQATDDLQLSPNTNYYIQVLAATGQAFGVAVLLSNDPDESLCGCTDASNCNFNPEALISDWSCGWEGCTDPGACNYYQYAQCDDGSCYWGNSLVAQLFHDLNGDGFWQDGFFGEPSLGNTGSIYVEELGITLFPDNNGYFIFPDLALGSYTIQYTDNSDIWTLSTGDTFTLTLPTCFGAEIGLIPTSNTLVQVSGPCCIWMMDIHCQNGLNPGLWVQNTGTVPLNGTFTMTFDPILVPDYLNDVEPYDSYSNGVMVWNIENQLPGESILYQCHINGPGVDYVGQVFPFDMVLELVDDDGNVVLTQDWLLEPTVTCAYDPNDKYAVPEGYTEQHFVLAEDEIEYRIRFQNTGNAPAELVVIEDQLDLARLDLSTFYPVFASHNYNTIVQDDGLVKFVFNNIMLPDSASDEPGSQGYVVYRIKSFNSLEYGDVINNTASIIFDLNPPIITNTTWHTIYDCAVLDELPETMEECEGEYLGPLMGPDYVEEYIWTLDGEQVSGNVSQVQFQDIDPGTYVLSLTTINPLCEVNSMMDLEIHANPGQELSLIGATLTASEGSNYVWYLDGEVIDGATDQIYVAQEAGTYYVVVTNEWGCSSTSESQDVALGISESEKSAFRFYPNPASESLTLNLNEGLWTVKIFNSIAELINVKEQQRGVLTLDISSYSSGLYFVEVAGSEGISRKSFIVE